MRTGEIIRGDYPIISCWRVQWIIGHKVHMNFIYPLTAQVAACKCNHYSPNSLNDCTRPLWPWRSVPTAKLVKSSKTIYCQDRDNFNYLLYLCYAHEFNWNINIWWFITLYLRSHDNVSISFYVKILAKI